MAAAIATIVAIAVLVGLGLWQIERKAWKEALIDTLTRRLSAPATDLPPRTAWTKLDSDQEEFRHVTFSAEFLAGRDALVYSSGSSLRNDAAGAGYWVFTPARLAGGSVVVINRGFVPQERKDEMSASAGLVDVVGVMRWPEKRGTFTPKDDPAHNLWFARDPAAMASEKGWGDIAPFYIEMESPAPPSGLPRPAALSVNLPNNHQSYVVTWFGLAAALAVIFVIWAARELRMPRVPGPPGASL